uniref:Uncharacterized protein n=1 Tax=Meloidogyne enterolobii TaxID=390850 RepID=A0A6V7UYW3_MELEN|nr:unnamed protein product [Meloidogyne enterolobii]
MYFNTFSKTFIVLIFVGFAPLLVKGMRRAPRIMQTGQPQQVHANPPTFSLTELSFLMKILDSTEARGLSNAFNALEGLLNANNIILEGLLAYEGILALRSAGLPGNAPIGGQGLFA